MDHQRRKSLADSRPPGLTIPLSGGNVGTHRRYDYEHKREFLDPRAWHRAAREMQVRSGPVMLGTTMLNSLVKRPPLVVRVAEGQSKVVADDMRRWLGIGAAADDTPPLGMRWPQLVDEQMDAVYTGACAHAAGYQWDAEAGLSMVSLERRQSATFWRYILDPATRRLAGIELRGDLLGGGYGDRVIPRYDEHGRLRLLYLAYQGGDHPSAGRGGLNGLGLLRPLYAEERDGANARQLMNAAMLRYSMGCYTTRLDVERFLAARFGQTVATVEEQRAAIDEESRTLREDHLATLDTSVAPALTLPNWWEPVTLLGDGRAFDPRPFIGVVDSKDRALAEGLFVAFVTQGRAGDGGSRAMVATQAGTLPEAARGFLRGFLLPEFRAQAVEAFLSVNYPSLPAAERPTVDVEDIEPPEWAKSSPRDLADAVAGGLVTWRPEDEAHYRAQRGLPEVELDELPSAEDRDAARAGGRLRTTTGQRRRQRGRLRSTEEDEA